MDGSAIDSVPLYTPSPERSAGTALAGLLRDASERFGAPFPDYDALHAFSVAQPDAFWRFLADRFLHWRRAPQWVRSKGPLPFTRWFGGSRLNVVDTLLWPPGVAGDHSAVIASAEGSERRRLTFAELRRETARVQAALRQAGIGPGDAVCAYAANVPETVVLLLACLADGIRFASCSPDFGDEAAAARFRQLRPAGLFASAACRYGGRRFDRSSVIAAIAARLPELRLQVALPVPGEELDPPSRFQDWSSWLAAHAGEAGTVPVTRALPFDQEAYVLYSSGTTGAPKGIRHRAGGALLNQWKEQRYHLDVRSGDRLAVMTTTGWMMWNWQVAGLGVGAALVLIDGSPFAGGKDRIWRIVAEERVTHLSTSAGYLHRIASEGVRPAEFDLSALRMVSSTGSSLSADGFRYVYREVKPDLHLASISGGTDVVSCFLIGVPTLPVYAGRLQRPGLGVDLAVFDEEGRDLTSGAGELVVRAPLPTMPLGFVGDADGSRYRAAYALRFPGVWTHGDRIERTEDGYLHHGRSDAVLNPGGVRIGSAEVTGPVLALPEVADAAAVPHRRGHEETIWLLVVPTERWTEASPERLRLRIRQAASPRHLPERIVTVPDLPRTRSGKTMELALGALANGGSVGSLAGCANPDAVEGVRAALARANDAK